jgi:hypothetical protein
LQEAVVDPWEPLWVPPRPCACGRHHHQTCARQAVDGTDFCQDCCPAYCRCSCTACEVTLCGGSPDVSPRKPQPRLKLQRKPKQQLKPQRQMLQPLTNCRQPLTPHAKPCKLQALYLTFQVTTLRKILVVTKRLRYTLGLRRLKYRGRKAETKGRTHVRMHSLHKLYYTH